MSKEIITERKLTAIGNAIRAKNGSADTYTPDEMAAAITALPSGGGVTVETGTFTPLTDTTANACVLSGDYSKVIAVEVYCDEVALKAATKADVAPFIISSTNLPNSYTATSGGYIGLAGYYCGYNASNQLRNGLSVAGRGIRIKEDYSELRISAGTTSNLFIANITYTYKIYKAALS